ncbi:MAG: hypothetical protein BHV63_03495 [Alistipes sp. 56_11]|nr:MAG: hypothetical protein BHV63_03495 [Alistipes sp. 56_11]
MKSWLIVLAASVLLFGEAAAQVPGTRSSEVVSMAGTDYYLHRVAPGETVYSLSRLYGVAEERFYEDNPAVKEAGLKAGETVRVLCTDVPEIELSRRKMQRTFVTHTVQPGETSYSIAKRYSLAINTLIQDNPGLDPSHLKAGQELLIRKSEMDKTSPQQILSQMDDFASTLTEVSDEYVYHLVEMGETLYAISREYGVTVADIEAGNDVRGGLKAGVLLRIPVPGRELAAKDTAAGEAAGAVGGGEHPLLPGTEVPFRESRPYAGEMELALLLPLSDDNTVRASFMEFYEGALIAADELRNAGHSVVLNLFNTERSPETVRTITAAEAFRHSDVIIGPVYEDELAPVAEYSRLTGVPVVSPLADLGEGYGARVFSMPPDPSRRYEKMGPLFEGDKNIVFITSDVNDAAFEREMKAVVGGNPYQRVVYRKGTPSQQIDEMLAGSGTDNVFVVLAGDETGVDLILAALSSVQNSRLARSKRTGHIMVVGNSRWVRYRNLDRSLFFKLNVSFVTSYHADRGNEAVLDFDRRYIEAFGRVPSLYSYRGYDAVKMFGGAVVAGNAEPAVWGSVMRPLQPPCRFETGAGGNTGNTEWALVTYGNDYTISVR